ncbi:hypothetical protein M406DRAFT_349700 [Cryphonectria parasitica EP155]|uniref:Uncharacterized protein n=1 Tax=Cryphonectria parasitica (strain ATCC 38755 / EP155) TaxID=660469 RepID=A0A9P4Y8Y1_CRYP1|nr:uncharacterized protein M406DRAFT_349700 [Cryphonectria parasitica EP155]KAF3768225.1 hypothetical protein M406DRAFT_349700 [Cryphonectria parasitica EP155]
MPAPAPPPSLLSSVLLALFSLALQTNTITTSDPISQKLFACDIAAYSDAELDRYLEGQRLSSGVRLVEVEDPENLPGSFIQRLRDRAQHTSNAAQSCPVDPAQLSARLLDISSDNTTSSRPRRPPPDPESPNRTLMPTPRDERERQDYMDLVQEGGRPLYAIDLINKVAENPSSYEHLWKLGGSSAASNTSTGATALARSLLWENYWHGYDAAWETLVRSGMLRPFETEEYICEFKSVFQRQHEEDQAAQALRSARSAAEDVPRRARGDSSSSRHTSAARMQRMEAARSRLEAAEEALALIKRRNDLIGEFKRATEDYCIEKREMGHDRIRMQWVLDQVPLVEAELNGARPAGGTEATRNHDDHDDDGDDEAAYDQTTKRQRRERIKRQKRDAGEPGPTPGARPKRSREDAADNRLSLKRLKRRSGDGDSLGSHGEMAGGAGTGAAGGPQGPEAVEAGYEHAAGAIERPAPKGSKHPSGHPQQTGSPRHASRPRTTSQLPRRSARIAARREALQAAPAPPSASRGPPQGSRRRLAQAPPAPTAAAGGRQDHRARLPPTKTRRQGARGGGRRAAAEVR